MDIREIREMTDQEIVDRLIDQKEALYNLRFQKASGQLGDPQSIKRTRRDIARLKTVQSERLRAPAEAETPEAPETPETEAEE